MSLAEPGEAGKKDLEFSMGHVTWRCSVSKESFQGSSWRWESRAQMRRMEGGGGRGREGRREKLEDTS